jgi:hypothetical protein
VKRVVNAERCIVRDRCPWCGRIVRVLVDKGAAKMEPHERSICDGSRMVWKQCGGGKDYVEPTTTDLWSETWASLNWAATRD